MPVTILRTTNGRLDAADGNAMAGLRARIAVGVPKIMLFLHGGLVSQEEAEANSDRLSAIGPTGFDAPRDWEQIYAVWRTGLLETLKTNWTDVFENDRLYRFLVKRLIGTVSGRLVEPDREGRSTGRSLAMSDGEIEDRLGDGSDSPFADYDDVGANMVAGDRYAFEGVLRYGLQLDGDLAAVADDIDAYLTEGSASISRTAFRGDAERGKRTLSLVDRRIRDDWRAKDPMGDARALARDGVLASLLRHAANAGLRVFDRLLDGRGHGLHATVAEEVVRELYFDRIGSVVWNMIRGDAAAHFEAGNLGDELLEALEPGPGRRLLVVGHSAGAIWASDMLLAAQRRKKRFELDLVLLAPAVRSRKFAEALDVVESGVGRFRLFSMRDVNERKDAVLGPGLGHIYPSSLLYLVSGLFESDEKGAAVDAPLLGMERFLRPTPWLTDAREIAAAGRVRSFLAAEDDRCVLSVASGPAGLRCSSLTHGGFDDDADTLSSIATFFVDA